MNEAPSANPTEPTDSTKPTAPTDSNPSTARRTGTVTEWNRIKGFGFIDEAPDRIFAHIRDFSERPRTPHVGDKVTFHLGQDRQGRACAQSISLTFTGVPLQPVHFVVLTALLIAPGLAIFRLFDQPTAWKLAGGFLLISALTYALYAWDKRRAQRGEWRVSERLLHLFELAGGWPGAFLAQQHLRHKNAKLSYRLPFWFIVLLHNYVAIDAQQNWDLLHRARIWLAALIAGQS